MTTSYHCSHLLDPHPPLPPTYPSSSSSFSPLDDLYFCEECDAIRCDQCVAIEVASYFCPSCLFNVPSANVRGDRNRCARSCFSCPQCASSLSVHATDTGQGESSTAPTSGSPYFLACSGCKWSSKEIGWVFEKPSGLALQIPKIYTEPEIAQTEFDALKDHLDTYRTTSTPAAVTKSKAPSRHVSHYTQMAVKALNRDVPAIRHRPIVGGLASGNARVDGGEKFGWDELGDYRGKVDWRSWGLEHGSDGVDLLLGLNGTGSEGLARLEARWEDAWAGGGSSKSTAPQRIPLQTKLTKRCPHPTCRHLLIQPDTKSTRMKIKMVAVNYLPTIELGRKRRRIIGGEPMEVGTAEDMERRRRERRKTRGKVEEEDEVMDKALRAGEILAFTNPLYDPIQIRLTQPHAPRNSPAANNHIHIPTQHFTVAEMKEVWDYEDEDDDDHLEGSEVASEESSMIGTISSRRSRMSVLGMGGINSLRDKKRDTGVDKRGNCTKVGVEVEISPVARGKVEFDLEVRYTYRAEEATEGETKDGKDAKPAREEYKSFTFWTRVHVGELD